MVRLRERERRWELFENAVGGRERKYYCVYDLRERERESVCEREREEEDEVVLGYDADITDL